ncbi:MAG: glycosyltransferase family 4 protein [Alphaproteobacteria bacterium]
MRAAFYAPMKPPDHAVPSGDRSIARLFMAALRTAGYAPEVVSTLRTWCRTPEGLAERQREAAAEANRLVAAWRDDPPGVWLTYHVYYKAPDWIGPAVCRALKIPYVIAEASYAPKRAGGPWALGHEATGDAIRAADLILSPTKLDMNCIAPLIQPPQRNVFFPPFLDHTPFETAAAQRDAQRTRLATQYDLDPDAPWLLTVAMMRDDAKRESYAVIAEVMAALDRSDFHYLIVGDGPAADDIKEMLDPWHDRVRFVGAVTPDALPGFYAAADLYLWPAVEEAFGMAFLEAQATGCPVVAGNERGVPDVVQDGTTGLLAPPRAAKALAIMVAQLLDDTALRATMGRHAAAFVAQDRSLVGAAPRLDALLAPLTERAT